MVTDAPARAPLGAGATETPGWRSFASATALLVTAAAVFVGLPLPHDNENVYLLRLRVLQDPSYLQGDWTFSGEFSEHLVFNRVFSPVTAVLSIEVLGWIGRVACWALLAVLLLLVAGRLGVRPLPGAVALSVWIPCQLRLVGSDWVFGTFEAKPVAYVFFFAALLLALRGSVIGAMVCSGLVVAFHPGVGVWASPPLVAALLIDAESRRAALRWCWLAALFAVPGVVGVLLSLDNAAAEREFYTFLVDQVFPFHLDPFFFGPANFLLLTGMFGYSVMYHLRWGPRTRALRLVGMFEILLAIPFAVAVVVFLVGADEWLKYLPFRVFPVLTTIFFVLDLALVWQNRKPLWRARDTTAAQLVLGATAALIIATLVIWNPVRLTAFAVRENYREWTAEDDDLERALRWVATDVPGDEIVIAPPWLADAFYFGEHPLIANTTALPWDAAIEWRDRIADLLGKESLNDGPRLDDEDAVARAYDGLTAADILSLVERYDARYLVSRSDYDFEVVHRSGDYRVFELPAP